MINGEGHEAMLNDEVIISLQKLHIHTNQVVDAGE